MFGTENGLNLYDKDLDQFKRISLKSKFKENILDLEEDTLGNLLIGTDNTGLFKLNTSTFEVVKVLNNTHKDLTIHSIKNTKQGKYRMP